MVEREGPEGPDASPVTSHSVTLGRCPIPGSGEPGKITFLRTPVLEVTAGGCFFKHPIGTDELLWDQLSSSFWLIMASRVPLDTKVPSAFQVGF